MEIPPGFEPGKNEVCSFAPYRSATESVTGRAGRITRLRLVLRAAEAELPRSALLRSAVEPTRDYPAAYKATAINHYATLAFNWWAVLDLNQYSSG